MSDSAIVLRRYGAGDTPALLDTLVDLWADAHTDSRDVTAAGFTPDTLRRQITGHARRDDFTLITAYADGHPVGFGYGFRCTPTYWFGETLLPSISEDARTTGALAGICELAVRPAWQGRGIGVRVHSTLLDALKPEWASLLAMPGNDAAQRLYHRLGYRYAGPYRSGADGPVLDLLLLHCNVRERDCSASRRPA
ncbi:GNAT family N-acetyltransferase [Streptomyces sp. SL13]|uniref:GNAT family N-acetyltransferase n=1 Tax=Streptantibioticus silvisoli TaxID=2705255 RepID=A0AA90KC34_9ACTN|nr:GNAT family N-acetyltransferase [Streptantibioticus silvisoli]MDI5974052.1 GNAT family N-acetyltransferase [Streptantibioticus silvisoli]